MDETNQPKQQFFTDENGIHYSRYGNNSPWIQVTQVSPRRLPLPDAYSHFPPLHPATSAGQPGPAPFSFPPNMHPSSNTEVLLNTVNRDPATFPLPEDDDDDFPPPSQILPRLARPAQKVGGARRADPDPKGKGKQAVREGKRKATSAAPDVKKQKGRVAGTANYTTEDIWGLLAILSERLPIGGKAWNNCADEFNTWAEENDRPVRTSKSLEAKFKQLVKAKKPTGDGEMPDYIQQAHEIEDAINERAGTRDLDDDDIADEVVEVSSDDEDENAQPPAKKIRVKKEAVDDNPTFTARRVVSDRITQIPPSRSSRASNALLSNISAALDPSTQAERSEERAARTFQTGQLFTLTSQLRESQTLVESLRSRLADVDRERQAAERRADRAEMMMMFAGSGGHPTHPQTLTQWNTAVPAPAPPPPPPQATSPPRWVNFPAPNRTPTRGWLQDVYYAGGGHCTRWINPLDPNCQAEPESPSTGTRFYGRFTPGSQRRSARAARYRYSPTARSVPRPRYSPSPLARRRHYTPSPLRHRRITPSPQAVQPVLRHRTSTPPPVASSSRHPDCIPEAIPHDK